MSYAAPSRSYDIAVVGMRFRLVIILMWGAALSFVLSAVFGALGLFENVVATGILNAAINVLSAASARGGSASWALGLSLLTVFGVITFNGSALSSSAKHLAFVGVDAHDVPSVLPLVLDQRLPYASAWQGGTRVRSCWLPVTHTHPLCSGLICVAYGCRPSERPAPPLRALARRVAAKLLGRHADDGLRHACFQRYDRGRSGLSYPRHRAQQRIPHVSV